MLHMPQTTNTPDITQYLTGPQVCARYGITPMSLWRWLSDRKYADLGFPQPALRIKERRYWREADLIAWERRLAPGRHFARA